MNRGDREALVREYDPSMFHHMTLHHFSDIDRYVDLTFNTTKFKLWLLRKRAIEARNVLLESFGLRATKSDADRGGD